MFLLLNLNRCHTLFWSFVGDFEQLNVGWNMGKYLAKVNNDIKEQLPWILFTVFIVGIEQVCTHKQPGHVSRE